jgi:hypothetical protein
MTILSLAMLWRTVGPAPLSTRDLKPSRIWAMLEDRGSYAWGRTVKFYENLKFVYQIQATLRQWQQQQEEEQRPAAGQENPGANADGRKLPVKSPSGSNSAPGGTAPSKLPGGTQ